MAVSKVDQLKPVYLIHGKEELLLERALRRLKDMVAAEGEADLDFDTFDGSKVRGEDVVTAANTLPFLSARRLVVVRDVDQMSSEDQAVLTAYVADPSPTACLVLVAASLAKNTRLYKALDAADAISEYAAPKRSELPGWVVALFKTKGRSISREGAEALVRAVGKDLRKMESEADKVIAYAGEKTELGAEDVEAVVTETAPTSIFEFLDALGARQGAQALMLLDDLLDGGEPLQGIHAMTLRHIRGLIGAQALRARGAAMGEMMRELKMADWQIRNLARQADRFRADELVQALKDAAEVEMRMKTSQGDPRLVFERWVVGVCDPSGHARTIAG